jgi:large subunit ribosomal protein L18
MRIRKKVRGTPECPRLSVFRSARHIYAQLIDDENGRTLASASTLSMDAAADGDDGGKTAIAKLVGQSLASQGTEAEISKVVFDRNGYLYHGRVKALAEGAREGGLKF